jgi:hypothetical protein
MIVAAVIVVFFILGMFLSMLGSSPRVETEWPADAVPDEDRGVNGAPIPAVADTTRV